MILAFFIYSFYFDLLFLLLFLFFQPFFELSQAPFEEVSSYYSQHAGGLYAVFFSMGQAYQVIYALNVHRSVAKP